MGLVRHPISFDNLNPETREALWEKVKHALVEAEVVEQQQWETDVEFRERLMDEAARYIHHNNFAVDYEI